MRYPEPQVFPPRAAAMLRAAFLFLWGCGMLVLAVTLIVGFWRADGERIVTSAVGLLFFAPLGFRLLPSRRPRSARGYAFRLWTWWSVIITLLAAAAVAFRPVPLAFKFGFPVTFFVASLLPRWWAAHRRRHRAEKRTASGLAN
jgi:hypothetical protein